MSRFRSRAGRSLPLLGVHANRGPLVAVGLLALTAAGCSSDVTRLDSPMFGLTESHNRIASHPVPREGMVAGSSTSLADATPVHGGGYVPQRQTQYNGVAVAALPGSGGPSEAAPHGIPRSGPRTYDAPAYHGSAPAYAPQPTAALPSQPVYSPPPTQSPAAYGPQPSAPAASAPVPAYAPPAREPAAAPDFAIQQSASPSAQQPSRVAARPQTTATNSGRDTIEVQPGDTLFGLSQRHNVSISELMSINGLSSPVLQPGQTLVVPSRGSSSATARRTTPGREEPRSARAAPTMPQSAPEHQAQPASASAPLLASPKPAEGPSRPIETATKAVGPDPTPPAAPVVADGGATHTLRSGESLYGIAVRYKVPLAELQRINNIDNPRRIKAGTVLKLPSGTNAATQIARPETARPAPTALAPRATEAASSMSGTVLQPTIINAPPKQVAGLERSGTVTDALPPPSIAAPAVQRPEAGPASQVKPTSGEAAAESDSTSVSKFRWPVKGRIIAGFGKRPDGGYSDGIKLAVPLGAEVHAAESGVVAYAGNELKGYGNLVLLRHDNGWITAYAHNDELNVKRGDRVRRGQVIAKAGNTGNVDQPQLHFELRQGSTPIDPIPHLE